jgi:hypothetical protein
VNITRGPYSANIDPICIAGRYQAEFEIVVSRYGMPLYHQLESDFEEAMRVAKAYIDWEVANYTDS